MTFSSQFLKNSFCAGSNVCTLRGRIRELSFRTFKRVHGKKRKEKSYHAKRKIEVKCLVHFPCDDCLVGHCVHVWAEFCFCGVFWRSPTCNLHTIFPHNTSLERELLRHFVILTQFYFSFPFFTGGIKRGAGTEGQCTSQQTPQMTWEKLQRKLFVLFGRTSFCKLLYSVITEFPFILSIRKYFLTNHVFFFCGDEGWVPELKLASEKMPLIERESG